MKKFVLGFLVGALIFSIIPVSAAVQEYVLQKSDCKLIINGKEYANKELPMLNYKGYNYIPADSFRQICEQIGAKFEWVNETKEIRIDKAESKTEDGDEISPVTQHETIDIVNADSLQKVSQDDLTGIKYNDVFYVNLDEATKKKYNLATSHNKNINEYIIVSTMTGEFINLKRNLDGYIESTDGAIYCRYDKISKLFNTTIESPVPQEQLPASEPVPTAEVDKLEVIEKDGMKGVMYDGIFYVEKDSLIQKYNKIDAKIYPDGYMFILNHNTGVISIFAESKDGYIKSSSGAIYINFVKLENIIKGA